MIFTFTIRTADYTQELEVQRGNRLGATPEELDRYAILMILGNVYTLPLFVTIGADKDDLSTVTVKTDCNTYLQSACRYCEARGFEIPKVTK